MYHSILILQLIFKSFKKSNALTTSKHCLFGKFVISSAAILHRKSFFIVLKALLLFFPAEHNNELHVSHAFQYNICITFLLLSVVA